MVRFRDDLYVSKAYGKDKKRKRLLKRLQNRKFVKKGVTLITFAANGSDLFDVFEANQLRMPWRKEDEVYVLGVAESHEEALGLVERMVTEVYQATGDFRVREYFGEKE